MNFSSLREGVQRAYSAVSESPQAEHSFPTGRRFAESLGYPPALLDDLPIEAVEAFAGVSNVSLFADIPAGARVLDLGCGAGLDSLIAARRTGPNGRVIGLDFSQAMVARASLAAQTAGIQHVEFRQADAEQMPIDDTTIDVALVNGIFNLNPARQEIFQELARVMKLGGVVYAAEIILREPLPPDEQADVTNWFA
jgi:SAM-dependent methyltransferase